MFFSLTERNGAAAAAYSSLVTKEQGNVIRLEMHIRVIIVVCNLTMQVEFNLRTRYRLQGSEGNILYGHFSRELDKIAGGGGLVGEEKHHLL